MCTPAATPTSTHKSTGLLRTEVWGRQQPPTGTWPPAPAPPPPRATAWLSSSPTAGLLCRNFHPTPASPLGDSQNEWNFPAAGQETHTGAGQAAQARGAGLTVGEPTLLENREPSGPRSTRWAGGSRGAGASPERCEQEQNSEALASLDQGHTPASAGRKGVRGRAGSTAPDRRGWGCSSQ